MSAQHYTPLAAWLATGQKSNLEANGEALPGIATVVDGHPVLALAPFGAADHRTNMVAAALLMMRAIGGTHIAICIDSYVRTLGDDNTAAWVGELQELIRPSEDPRARDGLVLTEMKPGWDEPRHWIRTYGRSDSGDLVWDEWAQAQEGAVASWVGDLLYWAVLSVPPVPDEPTVGAAIDVARGIGVAGPFMLADVVLEEEDE